MVCTILGVYELYNFIIIYFTYSINNILFLLVSKVCGLSRLLIFNIIVLVFIFLKLKNLYI